MKKSADSGRASKLPDEPNTIRKACRDLWKWKLVLIAALGVPGLGLMEKIPPAPLLLALIPLVAPYVDLLYYILSLRLLANHEYLRTVQQDPFEKFVHDHRRVFDMEDCALYLPTIAVCLLVAIIGAAFAHPKNLFASMLELNPAYAATIGKVLIASGGLGLLLSFMALWGYRSRAKLLGP